MYQKAVVIGPARLRVLHLDVHHCILVIVIGVRSDLVIMGLTTAIVGLQRFSLRVDCRSSGLRGT